MNAQSTISNATPSTTSTTSATTTTARTSVARLEVGGILLLMAGFGYINGAFIQPVTVWWGVVADLAHFVPLAALALLGLGLLRLSDEVSATSARRRSLRVGVTILAVFAAITCVVMIALGTFAPALGIGVQAFSDWMAVLLAGGGAFLWFAALIAGRRA